MDRVSKHEGFEHDFFQQPASAVWRTLICDRAGLRQSLRQSAVRCANGRPKTVIQGRP